MGRNMHVGSWRAIVTIVYCSFSWLGIFRMHEKIEAMTSEDTAKYGFSSPGSHGTDIRAGWAPYAIKAESIVRESLMRLIKRLVEIFLGSKFTELWPESSDDDSVSSPKTKNPRQSDLDYLMGQFLDKESDGGRAGLIRFMEEEKGAECLTNEKIRWTDPTGKEHKIAIKTLGNKLSELKGKRRKQKP